MTTQSGLPQPGSTSPPAVNVARIAAGLNGFPEGDDAAVLAAALAAATGAELMLTAIHPQSLLVLPREMDWSSFSDQAEAELYRTRSSLAPGARAVIDVDVSVPRALQRLVSRHHRDLLVLGSSRHGPPGKVRIGKRTRQLLGQCDCALAVAPRGLAQHHDPTFARVAVGCDGGPESIAALVLAESIARRAQAHLTVYGVVDDRLPRIPGFGPESLAAVLWEESVRAEMDQVERSARQSLHMPDRDVDLVIRRGRPADTLLEISREADLMVIGSRRWGRFARLLLGSTGEALLHDAECPVLVVPRPTG